MKNCKKMNNQVFSGRHKTSRDIIFEGILSVFIDVQTT